MIRCGHLTIRNPEEVLPSFPLFSTQWWPSQVLEMDVRPLLSTLRRPRLLLGFMSSLAHFCLLLQCDCQLFFLALCCFYLLIACASELPSLDKAWGMVTSSMTGFHRGHLLWSEVDGLLDSFGYSGALWLLSFPLFSFIICCCFNEVYPELQL